MAGLIKGNQWVFISPDHKGPPAISRGGNVRGRGRGWLVGWSLLRLPDLKLRLFRLLPGEFGLEEVFFLVGGFNPSEKYWSNSIISPGRGENKKCLKPPPSFLFVLEAASTAAIYILHQKKRQRLYILKSHLIKNNCVVE